MKVGTTHSQTVGHNIKMTPKQAIDILNRQRDRAEKQTHPHNDTWVVQTTEHIKDFFGENSMQYSYIKDFRFFAVPTNGLTEKQIKPGLENNKKSAVYFLNACIETINDKGLYKPPKKNFLASLSDTWLSVIFVTVIPSLFFVGIWVGEYRSDVKNIELRQELKEIRDQSIIPTLNSSNEVDNENAAQLTSDKNDKKDPVLNHDEK